MEKKTILTLTVLILIVIAVYGFMPVNVHSADQNDPINAFSTSSNSTSAQFFLGPIGTQLNSSYLTGLSSLSSQLAQIGQEQANGSIKCYPAQTTSNGPQPPICLLIFPNHDYDLIPIPPSASFNAPSLVQNGKPSVVYIGAQGCPFCAQERWVLVTALDRFGNFSKLFYDRSATVDGNIPTFTFNFSNSTFQSAVDKPPVNGGPYGDSNPTGFFYGNYYTSPYINFYSLDQVGSSFLVNESGISSAYPFIYDNVVSQANRGFGIKDFSLGGVPFFSINNQYVFDGATLNANIVFGDTSAYSTHQEMLNSIESPSSLTFGETALGAANILTAQICTVIKNAAPVCKLPYISEIQNKISNVYSSSVSAVPPFDFQYYYIFIAVAAVAAVVIFLFLKKMYRPSSKSSHKAESKPTDGVEHQQKEAAANESLDKKLDLILNKMDDINKRVEKIEKEEKKIENTENMKEHMHDEEGLEGHN